MPSEREVARGEKQDLTLAPNEFGWVMDEGIGAVRTHTGPMSSSLSQSEAVVTYNVTTRRFESAPAGRGKQLKVFVPEGSYCVLDNPAESRPREKEKDPTPSLAWGTRVVILGPELFALWPGQVAEVVAGHRLREDEYLVVQVYDAEAALSSMSQTTGRTFSLPGLDEDLPLHSQITTGALFIVEGTKTANAE